MKRCETCYNQMTEKALFTSTYWACQKCEERAKHKTKTMGQLHDEFLDLLKPKSDFSDALKYATAPLKAQKSLELDEWKEAIDFFTSLPKQYDDYCRDIGKMPMLSHLNHLRSLASAWQNGKTKLEIARDYSYSVNLTRHASKHMNANSIMARMDKEVKNWQAFKTQLFNWHVIQERL